MQKNFISLKKKKKVKKGLQEMVSFILSCLDRGLICSRVFQGGESRRAPRRRGLFGVFPLVVVFPIHRESGILAGRTEFL